MVFNAVYISCAFQYFVARVAFEKIISILALCDIGFIMDRYEPKLPSPKYNHNSFNNLVDEISEDMDGKTLSPLALVQLSRYV